LICKIWLIGPKLTIAIHESGNGKNVDWLEKLSGEPTSGRDHGAHMT
jgi:hypothetical protein